MPADLTHRKGAKGKAKGGDVGPRGQPATKKAGGAKGERKGATDGSAGCERCRDRDPICFRCRGEAWQACGRCEGMGELTGMRPCRCTGAGTGSKGSGKVGKGKGGSGANLDSSEACERCRGEGVVAWASACWQCEGEGRWPCEHCKGRGLFPCGGCGQGQVLPEPRRGRGGKGAADLQGPEPARGLTVTRCSGTEVTQIEKLWSERNGTREGYRLLGVWSLDNPHLSWKYRMRQAELRSALGRAPAELRGFHGSAPGNILSIAEGGFDAGRRAGQVYGAGEYFAKDPRVSVGYCRGGSFMLVCQLCLGHESSTQENLDGDHIWVPSAGYYVISSPAQVLPLYIVRCSHSAALPCQPSLGGDEEMLEALLARPKYHSGGAKDGTMIDLEFESLPTSIEARPAAWWSGDLSVFHGELLFDPENPHGADTMPRATVRGRVVVVRRGEGKFAAKVEHARAAGASALLVVQNSKGGPPIAMTAVGIEDGFGAAMVSAEDGEALISLVMSTGARLASAARRGGDDLPPNRPCAMTAESTDALWIGFLHAHFSDQQLRADVRGFLAAHCLGMASPKVRIVRGKFTQAKVALGEAVLREVVHALNSKPFVECCQERTVTVDDAHGSPDQRCPRSIARFCRGQNLRFIDPCWCRHDSLPTAGATFRLERVGLDSAKGDEICGAFLRGAPFHDGHPTITAIHSVHNPRLDQQYSFFRRYLTQKNGEAPREVELYHGTNIQILETVYAHGLSPPSDMEADDACPVSGGKGLRTSLCTNACEFCTRPHRWDRCHMFGLGIYLADFSQKSHRYISGEGRSADGRRECRMVVCSVLLGDTLQVEGHLRQGDCMHCVHSLRGLDAGDLPKMVDLMRDPDGKRPVDQKDILFIKGLKERSRPGFSVFNSEYISFHPYQCLPRYEIAYTV